MYKETVYLTTTGDAQKLFEGSVKVISTNGKDDYSHGMQLVRLPPMEFSNPGGPNNGSGITGSNPNFSPVVIQVLLEKSVVLGYGCCVRGDNLGDITISQVVSSKDLTKLTEYTLSDTYVTGWCLSFVEHQDDVTGLGIVATIELMCSAIMTKITQFDPTGTATGVQGAGFDSVHNAEKSGS